MGRRRAVWCSLWVLLWAWVSWSGQSLLVARPISFHKKLVTTRRAAEPLRELAELVSEGLRTRDHVVNEVRIDKAESVILGREVLIKKRPKLQLTLKRRGQCDIARNYARGAEADAAIAEALTSAGRAVATISRRGETWTYSFAGGSSLKKKKAKNVVAQQQHDRSKKRALGEDPSRPFLSALGVVDAATGRARPGREKKLRQIHRFAELLSHVVGELPENATLVDMGCGRGHLTFAAHALLQERLGRGVRVVGVERRQSLVDEANRVASDLGISSESLHFRAGEVADLDADDIRADAVIALHACDTATDDAIFAAIASSSAKLVVVAPCCHKEVRPQLESRLAELRSRRRRRGRLAPHDSALLDLASHGALADRHAEHVTDSMRALILEASGYRATILEWIPLEHTAKNTMLVATLRGGSRNSDDDDDDDVREHREEQLRRLAHLATYNGVYTHRLAQLTNLSLRESHPRGYYSDHDAGDAESPKKEGLPPDRSAVRDRLAPPNSKRMPPALPS